MFDQYKFYLKATALGRCYDKTGITYPDLEGTERYSFNDTRGNEKLRVSFAVRRGKFDVERLLRNMGASGEVVWMCKWSNQSEELVFEKLVRPDGEEVDEVCEDAQEILYNLGLIIRPFQDWIDDDWDKEYNA